jgi:SAM-dependent methyltransferase
MGPAELSGPLVCQETLQPLEVRSEGLWSESLQRLYPLEHGLVYMGYPQADQSMIAETMTEEREWQAAPETFDRDRTFLTVSAPRAVDFINLIGRHMNVANPVALELGSGSGWVSWLLAEAGYDVYFCDFEANSLALGRHFVHPRMEGRKRVVADARYPPFRDASFDLVVFKEFVHHVEDVSTLFREANRVLRPGGLLALIEPTASVVRRIYQIRHPDPHQGHRITWPERYLRLLKRSGFKPARITAAYWDTLPRNPVTRRLIRRAQQQIVDGRPLGPLDRVRLSLLGRADLVVIATKVSPAVAVPRPKMTVIDPATMTTSAQTYEAYGSLRPVVEGAAQRLRRLTS